MHGSHVRPRKPELRATTATTTFTIAPTPATGAITAVMDWLRGASDGSKTTSSSIVSRRAYTWVQWGCRRQRLDEWAVVTSRVVLLCMAPSNAAAAAAPLAVTAAAVLLPVATRTAAAAVASEAVAAVVIMAHITGTTVSAAAAAAAAAATTS